MCCETNKQNDRRCSCGSGGPACFGPAFWSKSKRIRMVEHSIECFQSQLTDLKELLEELKAEK